MPDTTRLDFGTPVRDAFLNVLAWVSLVCIVLLSITLLGVPRPMILIPLIVAALWLFTRQRPLQSYYRFANLLALSTPVFAFALLQQVANAIPVIDLTSLFLGLPSRVPTPPLPTGGPS